MTTRNVSESVKKSVAGRQYYKCANKPGSNLRGLTNYKCPLWKSIDQQGSFDESGYEIDHIIEHVTSKNDDKSNLQALCIMCHMVKTKRFMQDKKKDIHNNESKTNRKKGITMEEMDRDLHKSIKKYFDNDPGDDLEYPLELWEQTLRMSRIKFPELFLDEYKRYTKN